MCYLLVSKCIDNSKNSSHCVLSSQPQGDHLGMISTSRQSSGSTFCGLPALLSLCQVLGPLPASTQDCVPGFHSCDKWSVSSCALFWPLEGAL